VNGRILKSGHGKGEGRKGAVEGKEAIELGRDRIWDVGKDKLDKPQAEAKNKERHGTGEEGGKV
jgi:hypothetical protein